MKRGLTHSQRFLVWIVASVASVETTFAAIIAFLKHDNVAAVGWAVATAILLPAAAFVERIKISGGQ